MGFPEAGQSAGWGFPAAVSSTPAGSGVIAARIGMSANPFTVSPGVPTRVPLDTVEFDPDGLFFAPGNGFSIVDNGYYTVSASWDWFTNPSPDTADLNFLLTDSTGVVDFYFTSIQQVLPQEEWAGSHTETFQLVGGDTLSLYVLAAGAAAPDPYGQLIGGDTNNTLSLMGFPL